MLNVACWCPTGAEDVEADDMGVTEMEADAGDDLAPKAQVIITGCWLTMKEITLLLGSLAKCTPLPGGLPCPLLFLPDIFLPKGLPWPAGFSLSVHMSVSQSSHCPTDRAVHGQQFPTNTNPLKP